jgi:hypothetical protein
MLAEAFRRRTRFDATVNRDCLEVSNRRRDRRRIETPRAYARKQCI